MSWHVEADVMDRYQTGDIDRVAAASLEAHVTSCIRCRGLVTANPNWIESSWVGISERVEPRRIGILESVLTMVGVPSHVARIATLTPALRVSFLLAVVVALGFAALASGMRPEQGSYRVFLIIAPLIPVVGVALAFGRHVDPGYEWVISSPIGTFRLLLLRSTTVLAVSTMLALLIWPLVPAPVGPAAWLLPALTLTLLTLALASQLDLWIAATGVGSAWLLFAIGAAVATEFDPFGSTAGIGYLMLAVAAGSVVATRREAFDREGNRG